jgi:hypothetical protein
MNFRVRTDFFRLLSLSTVVALLGGISVVGFTPPSSVQAACCYFAAKDKDINQPGQKAFISWNAHDKKEAFTVQPKFEGNAADFGMVIPTPARPKLDEMPRDFFKDLALYTILMPLPQSIRLPGDPVIMYKSRMMMGGMVPMGSMSMDRAKGVRVLESGVVGSLDYKIIVAENGSGLFDWLKENQYSYAGDTSTLQYYIDKKSFFTVMKIDPKQMKKAGDGSYVGEVTPTRFSFSSTKCFYPLKITQLSVKDKTDALFYVQSASQMDLPGDWSWMHSYRPMYLTYMLGCCADADQQAELAQRSQWLSEKRRSQSDYETTKLEWAKKLGAAELSVLEDPKNNYGQMGVGDLPAGSKVITLAQLLEAARQNVKEHKITDSNRLKEIDDELKRMEDHYQPSMGAIVENDLQSSGTNGRSRFMSSRFSWYPNREAPLEEIQGLTILKGHLQKGQWLTKFRKQIRKDEMTQDLVLADVPKEQEQTYVRIMPTSPP